MMHWYFVQLMSFCFDLLGRFSAVGDRQEARGF